MTVRLLWNGVVVVNAALTVLFREASGAVRLTAHARHDEAMGDRTAADFESELAMLAYVRGRLSASEGTDFRIPTAAFDEVLDELNSLVRSPDPM